MPSTSVYTNESRNVSRATPAPINSAHNSISFKRTLDSGLQEAWNHLQTSNPQLSNGCFHPEFSRAVERVRHDVEYAVLKSGGEITGIFPFQRTSQRIASPVGGMMNDFQDLVAAPSTRVDFDDLLTEAGLKLFHFHALANDSASASSRLKQVYRVLDCPLIDLSKGAFRYRDWLVNHSSTVRRQPQKTRALIRKQGQIRLEFDCRDPQILERVIDWKRARFRRTRTFDLLSVDWIAHLLRELFHVREDGFRGQLSVLWAGDVPVSGHFGILCRDRLHYYIPAHDHRFAQFSPGTELMYQVTSAAGEHGIQQIDLGSGDSPLKDRFANGKTVVECGCFGFSPVLRSIHHRVYEARQALKRIPMKEPLKRIVRSFHPNLGKGRFR